MFKKAIPAILLIVLACTWGSSFFLMKRGMETADGFKIFSDTQVGALRMIIASVALLPLTILYFKKLRNYRDFLSLTLVGLCGNFLPAFLFTYAETELSSGYAGMLNSFTPIFTLLIGGIIFKQKLTSNQFIGVSIGFIGMVLLMNAGHKFGSAGTWKHITAIIFATFFYAISLNTIKHRLSHLKSMEITSLAFGILFIPGLFAFYFTDTISVVQDNKYAFEGLGYIVILSVVGTAIALIVFNKIIAMTSTLFASSVTYFIPIVAVLMGLLIGERINSLQIYSMGIVLIGVLIANYWKRKV